MMILGSERLQVILHRGQWWLHLNAVMELLKKKEWNKKYCGWFNLGLIESEFIILKPNMKCREFVHLSL